MTAISPSVKEAGAKSPKYTGIPITTTGNELVAYYTEARIADAGIFYPITPSTEQGEHFQLSFARGELNAFGNAKVAIETEGEHAAQGGAIAYSLLGKRVVNFTSGQGIAYGIEQYHHAPGKLSTMVLEVAARALTRHALNVHCGHDDVYLALDTGWIVLYSKDAQQASDQALILRRVTEKSLTPGMNAQDGFLTSHLERTFLRPESGLIREFLGRPEEMIDCPTEGQRAIFGPRRRRVPVCFDLQAPALLGSVQNQEHYMQGVAARRNNFVEPILGFLEESYEEFARLTGRRYGLISQYNCQGADTVFVCMGSAAENIEAAIDFIRARTGEEVGVIHLNVLRPFPEAAIIEALAGKTNVAVLERIDDQLSGEGPMTRDIRTALAKALENSRTLAYPELPSLEQDRLPRIFHGVYGLGSRDFRPEGILGAWEFVTGRQGRQDGKRAADGASFFYVGIDHPYAVCSEDRPSLLPDRAIAVRLHSIGGWGMITTGKNLGGVLGAMGNYVTRRDHPEAKPGESVLHISANPKYGSEKKGAPTNYFLVMADEKIRVNCDLQHVDVVLCCDPKIFTHTNPLVGLKKGGAFVWESSETDDRAVWTRIPLKYRQEIIHKGIRLFVLNGFAIAQAATEREDLQYRMQGNAFLGAFFRVSSFLQDYNIPKEEFLATVRHQYDHKFGRFGSAVVESNMTVMREGFGQVRSVDYGPVDAPDRSSMRGEIFIPLEDVSISSSEGLEPRPFGGQGHCHPSSVSISSSEGLEPRPLVPLFSLSDYDREFRSGLGYHTPATPRAATGVMAAATGKTVSKYGARRQVPLFVAENCTQCMDCITSCPDTALPNTAQDLSTILSTIFRYYVSSQPVRARFLQDVGKLEASVRERMRQEVGKKRGEAHEPFPKLLMAEIDALTRDSLAYGDESALREALGQIRPVVERLPAAYGKTTQIFKSAEKKNPGAGGIFSIFVSDLCKGCGECATECGDKDALVMVEETEQINADHQSAVEFLNLLPDTPGKFLGKYDPSNPLESRAAVLQYHLMVQSNYQALLSGDGACAGCGEKTILRAVATITEAFMRPLYHERSARLEKLADRLESEGVGLLERLRKEDEGAWKLWRKTMLHTILGHGGVDDADTEEVMAQHLQKGDAELVGSLVQVLRVDAYNHRHLQTTEGGRWNGMSVMGMTASTGCNTVYGSTHPNNPHPYPWINSLFQDGATIGWLMAEGFIVDHARRSVIPERLGKALVDVKRLTDRDYWDLTHFTDALMTDREVQELPKVWAIGGDGAFGDIGFQNVSKATLQNRPNLQMLLLDTQVYSNTGGQNSDSSVMPGGFDMNQFGAATQGKLTEKKEVALALISGHGSPFVAQVSMANSASLFRALLDGLAYRGTAFIQAFTTCQPEHGVPDDHATIQAQRIRDARGMPEFVFDAQKGETYGECLSLKGNPSLNRDWHQVTVKATRERYSYTVVHWARTEARFRRHFQKIDAHGRERLPSLEDLLPRITQNDVVRRRYTDPSHRSFIPADGSWTRVLGDDGQLHPVGISRHMVLFCVERRKNWRMLQSKAGLGNIDRAAQFRLLRELESGALSRELFMSRTAELMALAVKLEKEGSDAPVATLLP